MLPVKEGKGHTVGDHKCRESDLHVDGSSDSLGNGFRGAQAAWKVPNSGQVHEIFSKTSRRTGQLVQFLKIYKDEGSDSWFFSEAETTSVTKSKDGSWCLSQTQMQSKYASAIAGTFEEKSKGKARLTFACLSKTIKVEKNELAMNDKETATMTNPSGEENEIKRKAIELAEKHLDGMTSFQVDLGGGYEAVLQDNLNTHLAKSKGGKATSAATDSASGKTLAGANTALDKKLDELNKSLQQSVIPCITNMLSTALSLETLKSFDGELKEIAVALKDSTDVLIDADRLAETADVSAKQTFVLEAQVLLRCWKAHCHAFSENSRLAFSAAWTQWRPTPFQMMHQHVLDGHMSSETDVKAGVLAEVISHDILKANVTAALNQDRFDDAAGLLAQGSLEEEYGLGQEAVCRFQVLFLKKGVKKLIRKHKDNVTELAANGKNASLKLRLLWTRHSPITF